MPGHSPAGDLRGELCVYEAACLSLLRMSENQTINMTLKRAQGKGMTTSSTVLEERWPPNLNFRNRKLT